MATISRRTYIHEHYRTDPTRLPIAGSSSPKRHSAISSHSALTAETYSTPPRTPSPGHLKIPITNLLDTSAEESDERTREKRSICRAHSAERTRTWAEEVERQRVKADLKAERRRYAGRDGANADDDGATLSGGMWGVSTGVIDALADELGVGIDPMSHLPDADRVISNLTKKSIKLNTSDSEDLSKAYTTSRSSQRTALRSASQTGGEKQGQKSSAKRRIRRKSVTSGIHPPLAIPPIPITPPATAGGQVNDLLSIDDIIKKHVEAVDGAVAAANERIRKDLGMPQTAPSLDLSSSPTATVTSQQNKISSSSPRAPASPIRASFLNHKPGSGSSDPPFRDSSLPLPRSPLNYEPVRNVTTPELDPTRDECDHASAGPRSPAPVEPLILDSAQEEAMIDLIMRQALLDRLESGSIASSHNNDPVSLSPPSGRSARPSHDRVISSPTPSSTRLKAARRFSTTKAKLEEDAGHNIAVYLRSSRLNRYVRLPRPFPERPLQVSLADLGSPTGTPVLVFLGIGCVRHLMALFDDLARALGLRLICIDRWGFGKTTNVPQDRRGPMEWAGVVERVLDELEVGDVRIIAHSAGAPYAAATALRLGHRIKGKINFLAPWINAEIDAGYKWLKWVPNGVIKSAFAAEWKLQSYRLGKPPPLVHKPISHVAETGSSPTCRPATRGSSHTGLRSGPSMSSMPPPDDVKPSLARRTSKFFTLRNDLATSAVSLLSPISPLSAPQPKSLASTPSGAPVRSYSADVVPSNRSFGNNAQTISALTSSVKSIQLESLDTSDQLDTSMLFEDVSFLKRAELKGIPQQNVSDVSLVNKPPTDAALLHALDQASHAECEPGTTDDLLAIILNRPARPWGFSYADLTHPATIWWGSEDERISEKSVRWMERVMCGGAELKLVQGGDHNLMRNVPVMCEIFQSIADETRLGMNINDRNI